MNPSRPAFPPELSDYIIDLLKPFVSHDEAPDRECVLALVACSQVCRAWLPCARACLYASIWITECKTMTRLLSALSIQPTLAPLVKRVVAGSTRYPDGRYIPLLALLSQHPELEELMIVNTPWSHEYPLAQTARLGRRTSVTHLVLHNVHFASPIDFLHLVCSFDKIVRLTLSHVNLTIRLVWPNLEEELLEQLQARRKCWAAPSLRVLDVHYGMADLTFLPLFGHGLHRFSFKTRLLNGLATYGIDFLFGRCVSLYQDLRHLSCTLGLELFRMVLRDGSEPSALAAADTYYVADPESTYKSLCNVIANVLAAARSPRLRSLSLSFYVFAFHMLSHIESVASPQYMCTRTDFLDVVFGKPIRDILSESPAFADLSELSFGIHEDAPDVYGPEWWRAQVRSRLREPWAGAVDVAVRFVANEDEDHVLCPFWEPESRPRMALAHGPMSE